MLDWFYFAYQYVVLSMARGGWVDGTQGWAYFWEATVPGHWVNVWIYHPPICHGKCVMYKMHSTYNIQHNCTNFGVRVGSHHFITIFSLVLFLCLLRDFISQPWHERAVEFDLLIRSTLMKPTSMWSTPIRSTSHHADQLEKNLLITINIHFNYHSGRPSHGRCGAENPFHISGPSSLLEEIHWWHLYGTSPQPGLGLPRSIQSNHPWVREEWHGSDPPSWWLPSHQSLQESNTYWLVVVSGLPIPPPHSPQGCSCPDLHLRAKRLCTFAIDRTEEDLHVTVREALIDNGYPDKVLSLSLSHHQHDSNTPQTLLWSSPT